MDFEICSPNIFPIIRAIIRNIKLANITEFLALDRIEFNSTSGISEIILYPVNLFSVVYEI